MENDHDRQELKKMVEKMIVNFCGTSQYKAQITSEAIFNLLRDESDLYLTQKLVEPRERDVTK